MSLRRNNNGRAFLQIVVKNGIHKLSCPCRVYSDGCGSMVHAKEDAVKVGIDHAYIPPHQQSLNEAEKVCDTIWSQARAFALTARMPDSMFGKAVDLAMYVDMRCATTESRGWKTPYELAKGIIPVIPQST